MRLSPADQHQGPASALFNTLMDLKPDILIVDRLWFSLYHFISDLPCRKIFLTIQVRDDFFRIALPGGTLSFRGDHYNRVLAIEPFESSVPMERINPIILRNRNEIYSREEALQKLGFPREKNIALIALNFKGDYYSKLKTKYAYLEDVGYDVIYTTNLEGGGIFPVVDYFNAIDLVICGAGYNQFWEVIYFDKESVFENVPLNFSDTEKRIRECQEFSFEINGADQLVDIITKMRN